VHSLQEVAGALEKSRAQRVWVVLSGQTINYYSKQDAARLSAATRFTTWDCARRVYSGRDGLSDVWVIDRTCFLGHAAP
jgi:hypothetical protein